MSEFVGVKCYLCEAFIKIGEQHKDMPTGYVVSDMPYPCDECGASYLYKTADIIDELGEPLPWAAVYPQPTPRQDQ